MKTHPCEHDLEPLQEGNYTYCSICGAFMGVVKQKKATTNGGMVSWGLDADNLSK